MIFAKNTTDGTIALEAFEFGVALPYVLTPQQEWCPAIVGIDSLHEDYVDIRDNDEVCKQAIDDARIVTDFILRKLDLSESDLHALSLGSIRASMDERLGKQAVSLGDVRRDSRIFAAASMAEAVQRTS